MSLSSTVLLAAELKAGSTTKMTRFNGESFRVCFAEAKTDLMIPSSFTATPSFLR